jgi:hypothetical protein
MKLNSVIGLSLETANNVDHNPQDNRVIKVMFESILAAPASIASCRRRLFRKRFALTTNILPQCALAFWLLARH